MSFDGHKVDNNPDDPVDGIFNASDMNDLVAYLKSIGHKFGTIDGGNALGEVL